MDCRFCKLKACRHFKGYCPFFYHILLVLALALPGLFLWLSSPFG